MVAHGGAGTLSDVLNTCSFKATEDKTSGIGEGVNNAGFNGLSTEDGGCSRGQHGVNLGFQQGISCFDEGHPLLGVFNFNLRFTNRFFLVKRAGQRQHRSALKTAWKTVQRQGRVKNKSVNQTRVEEVALGPLSHANVFKIHAIG